MVDVRCQGFNDVVWSYVAEYAVRRKMTRCEALGQIVIDHMRLLKWAEEVAGKPAQKRR